MPLMNESRRREAVRRVAEALVKNRNQKPAKWYVLIYDLNAQTGKYQELEAKLKEIGAVEVLESTYFFESRLQTAAEAWAMFKPYIDASKERAIILEISGSMYDSGSDR